MKVLHLLNSNRFSGAENVVCQIIGMFCDDTDIEMVYASHDGQIREALTEKGINFVPISKMSVKEIRRVIKEEKPDIIHAHDMRASFYAARACGRIPLVSHIHNNAFDSRGFSVKSIAYLYAAKKAKHIFWVSQSAFDGYSFHNLLKNKSNVLQNIIDIDKLHQKMQLDTNQYDYDISYIGRLTFQKNPQRLMNVFQLVKEKKPDAKIAVVGTGELEEETKIYAKKYKLLDNVHFLGFQTNPLKILYDSKVMVMTSRWEGLPMCSLEAMALGVPIVSTPVDGLKDIIVNGENGYLADDDETIAEYIISIICDKELHKSLSENAVKKACAINDKIAYKKALLAVYKN